MRAVRTGPHKAYLQYAGHKMRLNINIFYIFEKICYYESEDLPNISYSYVTWLGWPWANIILQRL